MVCVPAKQSQRAEFTNIRQTSLKESNWSKHVISLIFIPTWIFYKSSQLFCFEDTLFSNITIEKSRIVQSFIQKFSWVGREGFRHSRNNFCLFSKAKYVSMCCRWAKPRLKSLEHRQQAALGVIHKWCHPFFGRGYTSLRVVQKPSFLSNWKIDGRPKIFWLFMSKSL